MKRGRDSEPKPPMAMAKKPAPVRGPRESFDHETGDRLGRALTITKTISAGPFTEIYQVWCAERMGFFTLKMMRDEVDIASPERRFLARERAILSRLAHPHIVRVYEADPELSRQHLLMEYLPGPSLLTRLSAAPKRRLNVVDAVTTGIQLAGALGQLHERGYLYRDLKPANVLEGHSGSVLIDFGSVFRFRSGRIPRERLGTDPYMAPEQCIRAELTPATDIYGLGALLYEMLTGEWPFEHQLMNVFDRSRLENRFPQLVHEVKPLRKRTIDQALDEVIRRCLSRDPSARFQSAGEVLNELLAFADGLAEVIPGAAA